MIWTDIKLQALCELPGLSENFSALGRGEGSKRSRIESGVLKSETTVHTIRRELQSRLFDVPLMHT